LKLIWRTISAASNRAEASTLCRTSSAMLAQPWKSGPTQTVEADLAHVRRK